MQLRIGENAATRSHFWAVRLLLEGKMLEMGYPLDIEAIIILHDDNTRYEVVLIYGIGRTSFKSNLSMIVLRDG